MAKLRIIIDQHIPYIKGLLEDMADTVYLPGDQIGQEEVKNADALIVRTRTRCDRQLLEGSQIRFIATATIGYDHIDTGYCASRQIAWCNAPGCNAASVAQYILAALTTYEAENNFTLAGKQIGIIGVGNVGSKIARIVRSLGMKTLLNDPPKALCAPDNTYVSLQEIEKKADIITFHTPLTHTGESATYHLADAGFFARLQKKPLIINSARGEIVDNGALLQALRQQQIRDIIIDCWENEPHPHPQLLDKAFIATPHIAGYSADGKANGAWMAANAVRHFFHFKPCVAPIQPPAPPKTEILFSSLAKSISATYNIKDDSHQLKQEPDKFESQRNHYPLRREPKAFTLLAVPDAKKNQLRQLGFTVK